ncbi:MAG: PHP domain-containing protein [Planctomycetota bacterium]
MNHVKTLIHVHTNYSFDSDISPKALASFADREDIGCIAVTDHDTIEGAKHLAAISPANVIVGSEITTRDGHLIGLFLKENISAGLSARDTAEAIKQQGGLVFLPHPFVLAFGCGLGKMSWEIADLVDAVEVNNAQNLSARADRLAKQFAAKLNLPSFVGADSHMQTSIAPCYQLMRPSAGPADFLAALNSATLVPGFHPLSYFLSTGLRVARHLLGFSLPTPFGLHAAA